ncbi:NAD(P)H-dependent oxidoreductase [Coraliomargarita sp. SDUM461003]|uniref:NAD(P)H-dependent oxidoreductase n=2 Tax=Thalassobacterium TaxID=3410851 RepID=A0ABU1B0M5_9BACT|nr:MULTISPECIES: NAD(P)H-dependent oxidoreductase [unclassified Coraliomargarita]MDQ8194496.1 NAD(P)H-dependent oxidoreductase [Coraliomargarita sp. SDUM461004]MDQ8208985.1 NAD(P)H-dependent oxidoreductase [Coraliomargarita sp. SDUM461003]
MKKLLLINGHEPYPFSEGKLNAALLDKARAFAEARDYEVQQTSVSEGYDVDVEVGKHQWADLILLQFPINWMTVPWSLKKYMDEVYTAGMDGRLCNGDGRTRKDPTIQYGQGGTLQGRQYMLSVTFNAPEASFNDAEQYLFQGHSVDDLLLPVHMNFRFFGMEALESFACYDVMKNPNVDSDFKRFEEHLSNQL